MVFGITLLIISGLALILVEILVVPGTTFIGILGFLFAAAGIYYTYSTYGSTTGNYVLISTLVLGVGGVVLAFRSGSWKKFKLNATLNSKVNLIDYVEFVVGAEGKAISALRPSGTAMFKDKSIEVHSQGDFIESNTDLRIIAIEENKIIVEQIKK